MTSAKVLLVLHGALSVALLGAAVHNGVLSVRLLLGLGVNRRLQRLYPRLVLWMYIPNFVLGAALYPTFRVDVRAGGLDASFPWAVAAFELKEHALVLGLLTVAAQVWLTRDGAYRAAGWCGLIVAAVVVYGGLTGLTLSALRPV
ncbi:MAG: hypothetical protein ACFB9M_01475 [Myxococcota bacterium]